MTAFCGGGTSSPKVGTALSVAYGSGLIANLLIAAESPWLIPVIPLLTLPPLVTNVFCGTDPAAMPTFTSAEADALLKLKVGTADWNSGLPKVTDLLNNALWRSLCDCDNGTPIPPPVGPAAPSGTPTIVLPSTGNIQPCNHFIFTTTGSQGNPGTINRGGPILTGLFPTSLTYFSNNFILAGGGVGMDFIYDQLNSSNVVVSTITRAVAAGANDSIIVPAAATLNSIRLTTTSISGSGSSAPTQSTVDSFCGTGGLPLSTTTCAPDPNTIALLEAIMQMVTLIQRQSVPFAYVTGATHSALHGTGEFTLSQPIIGLKIHVSNIDGSVGEQLLDPNRLFDVGWVAVGDLDGFWCQQRVTNPDQLMFPRSAGAATKVGWATTSGAILDITELVREP